MRIFVATQSPTIGHLGSVPGTVVGPVGLVEPESTQTVESGPGPVVGPVGTVGIDQVVDQVVDIVGFLVEVVAGIDQDSGIAALAVAAFVVCDDTGDPPVGAELVDTAELAEPAELAGHFYTLKFHLV